MPVGVTMISSAQPYSSPTFGRSGQNGVFTIEILNLEGGATLDVEVQHKNQADTAWTPVGSFPTMAALGPETLALAGLKEQIRFRYTVAGAPPAFVHVIVYAPTWRD